MLLLKACVGVCRGAGSAAWARPELKEDSIKQKERRERLVCERAA